MAKKYHPDSGDDAEVKKFHKVAEAYKILSDPDSKKAYDIASGVKEEVKKVEAEAKYKTAHAPKRDSHRDVELKEFHKNRYKKAVMRVVGFSFFVGLIGYLAAVIIGGIGLLGGASGVFIGFSLSIHKNFKVSSFFDSDKSHLLFRIFTWSLFAIGLMYFTWLIARGFF